MIHWTARGLGFVFLSCLLWAGTPAAALDFWDGRVQVHGFLESRMSFGWEDFSGANDIELMQWQQVLNVEIEADLAPDGFGPFDMVSAFARVEVKFDCVWTRACSLSDSVSAFGDRPERLPQRVSTGRRDGYYASQFTGDVRPHYFDDETRLGFASKDVPAGSRKAVNAVFGPTYFTTFGSIDGGDGIPGTFENPGDDPAFNVYASFINEDCRVGHRKLKSDSLAGFTSQELFWRPGCDVEEKDRLRDVPNPFNVSDPNPVFAADPGTRATLPFRPGTARPIGETAANDWESQGLFIPNMRYQKMLQDGEFDSFDQNYTVNELQWNRGAAQQQTKELKEAYVDIEMFDYRLWIRAGKQTIVWGKTELFRNQDLWNPVDISLGPLAALEETRLGQWAIRGVWSFYKIGDFEDVRLEVVALADSFQPSDIGRCGEPFVARAVCAKAWGLNAHGMTGAGVAGEIRPPDPWNSWKGWEIGARLEWRWDRLSFALSDYYGFNDSFYLDPLFSYTRNVDPMTGRPREGMSTGSCRRGNEDACLRASEALTKHSVNQQVFHFICANTVGLAPQFDPAACAQTLFNIQSIATDPPGPTPPVSYATVFSSGLSGQVSNANPLHGAFFYDNLAAFTVNTRLALDRFPWVNSSVFYPTGGSFGVCNPANPECPLTENPTPLVSLNMDINDGPAAGPSPVLAFGLQPFLTTEQEALLGCGPFYGTDCDLDGIDLLNAEASMLLQAFPWIEGTVGTDQWDTTAAYAQPGTLGFQGGGVCTVYDQQTGESFILPGCRQPGDHGYDPRVDGTRDGIVQPFTGQPFSSELAGLSWNFLMLATALGAEAGTNDPATFDPDRPFEKGRCSFATPQFCAFVKSLNDLTRISRSTVRAGGNGRYGRRYFTWASTGDFVIRYEKRNVLGLSMDFAEDFTKTNWGLEMTWQEGLPFANNNEFDTLSEVDTFNLTISVDRPTFVNFLNSNRTFLINSQLFISYIDGYQQGMTANGPWTFLWLVNASTGYFRDRFLVGFQAVWDFRSNSGAFLPNMTYRYTENLSVTLGAGVFAGRWAPKERGVATIAAGQQDLVGNRSYVENGVSAVRDLDNVYLRLRYTF